MTMFSQGNLRAAYTANEDYTAQGLKYSVHRLFSIPSNSSVYVGVIIPAASDGLIAAFNSRYTKQVDGDLEIAIHHEVTSGIILTDELISIRGNRNYPRANKTHFYNCGAVAPAVSGAWIEQDISMSIGNGSNRAGFAFPDSGWRVFAPDDKAAIRMTNSTNAAVRVVLAYSWVEIRNRYAD
jgi:hypothetical protein